MGLMSRTRAILAASISREVKWRQQVSATTTRDIMEDSIGGLSPGRDSGPNSLQTLIVKKDVTLKMVGDSAEQTAEFDSKGTVKCTESEFRAHGVKAATPNESSWTINCEESKNSIFTAQIEQTQSSELNSGSSLHKTLKTNYDGIVEAADSQNPKYPIPLSPFSGELAKSIEYERAMVAETAMKSGPSITSSEILFEDEWLLVVNKPSGVYCEHVLSTAPSLLTPANSLRAKDSSLSRLTLRRPVDNEDASGPHLHMANRLDRDTSGVMVITKCKSAAGKLSNIFTERQVQKSYIALCRGPRPAWESLTVDSGHGRSRYGAWRVYSKQDVGRGLPGGSAVRDMTTRLTVMAVNRELEDEKQAVGCSISDETLDSKPLARDCLITAGDESASGILGHRPYEQREANAEDSSHNCRGSSEGDDVLIRAMPVTGRTHQIRLHCQFVGLPLRGDVKYGGPHSVNGVKYDHHALHAESLSFRHPFTFEELRFVAPLPEWATEAGVSALSSEV